MIYQGPLWFSPVDAVPVDLLPVMAERVIEQPFYGDLVSSRLMSPRRITDYVSNDVYQRTTLYNEFFKKIGTDTQVVFCMQVTPRLMVSCSLLRLKVDFTDRECTMLGMLSAHLIQAFRHSLFVINTRKGTSEPGEQIILELSGDGRMITHSDDRGPSLLMKYFGSRSGLPGPVVEIGRAHV